MDTDLQLCSSPVVRCGMGEIAGIMVVLVVFAAGIAGLAMTGMTS